MKITGRSVEGFLKAPRPGVEAVLIYGPDSGLVRERSLALARNLGIDSEDPFAQRELAPGEVASDPAGLHDECAALSLTGDRRLVLLRGAGDNVTPAVEALLADPPGAALLILEAGDLPPRSRLRKLCEQSDRAAALPCYQDSIENLPRLIREMLSGAGLEIAPDALDHLVEHLGADRQMTRSEIEKLVLYAGGREEGQRIERQHVAACLADGALQTLDDLTLAVADGDLVQVDRSLRRLSAEGANAITLLRALARHFQRLASAAEAVAAGSPAEQAVEKLRPPVFWKHKGRVAAQLRNWSKEGLQRAEQELLETEILCKSSGLPMATLAEQAVLTLAQSAPAARGARRI